MKYRVTCLTPTLVGDGQRLSPIDYMVWKDHVNVLDQNRIFRLLARGPRLEGYLTQLKRAEKLDFASWGGFAQNYAGRRIPFEHASSTPAWERARAENLFIPTFATGPQGPYLPGSALKGAIRSALVAGRASLKALGEPAQNMDMRALRQVTQSVEDSGVGPGGSNAMRLMAMGDSSVAAANSFRVYLIRVSTLEPRGAGRFEVGWKLAPRGASKRAEDATPIFAEMASPGAVFEGPWHENTFLSTPEVAKALRAGNRPTVEGVFAIVNAHAERLLALQIKYAEAAGLNHLHAQMAHLSQRLAAIRETGHHCILPLGWAAGFFSKSAFIDTAEPTFRSVLGQLPFYSQAIKSNLPFPKTRRIVFLNNQPATLPGFIELEIG